jgi:DNA-binding MarR family transcriptional regulator
MGSHESRGGDSVRAVVDDLRRLVRWLRVASGELERNLGVSAAQLFVLRQLGQKPAGSIAELAARTLTDPSSVSVVVSRLHARELVARVRRKDDQRCAELTLTARGRAVLRRAPRTHQEQLIAALERLPAARRSQLAGALAALTREVGIGAEPPVMFFEEGAKPSRARASSG